MKCGRSNSGPHSPRIITAHYLQIQRLILPLQGCCDGRGFHLSATHICTQFEPHDRHHCFSRCIIIIRLLKGTHREAFSVRYSNTSCNLADGGNWRSWGTWLQAEQFSCQPKTREINLCMPIINERLLIIKGETYLSLGLKCVGVQSIHIIKDHVIS